MWKPKNLVQALLPIYILNFLFGHGLVQYSDVNKYKVVGCYFYSIITTIIYFTSLISILIFHIDIYSSYDNILLYLIILKNIFIMIFNIISSWIHRKVSDSYKLIKINCTVGNRGNFD